MSIDRIGKGTGVGTSAGATETGSASTKKTFSVESAGGVSGAAPTSPADAVRAGSMDAKAYVDLRVEEATRHLEGKLGPADLDGVRSLLRSQIESDPTVRELVKAATGSFPPSNDDALARGDEPARVPRRLARRRRVQARSRRRASAGSAGRRHPSRAVVSG